MARHFSIDLRTRVAAAIACGESCRSIAERFEIAPSTVVKWSKRVHETGSPAPAKFGGYRTCTLDPHRGFILAQIAKIPHVTQHGLKDLLAKQRDLGLAVRSITMRSLLIARSHAIADERASECDV